MRDTENTIYYVDMSAEEIYEAYEQMTLREAYQKQKISLKEIFASFWLFILTNALCILLCSMVIIAAGLIAIDCFTAMQITTSILNAIQELPFLFVTICIVALAGLYYAVTINTMQKEVILVEKEVASNV